MTSRTTLRCVSTLVLSFFVAWTGTSACPFTSSAYAGAKDKPASKEKKEKQDPREMQAREAFAAGSYKDALDLFTKLYAEKLHPTYLRNIARCYQNLNEPDRAISSFREYLRKAKDLTSDERAEVEGYIHEMEEAKKKADAAEADKNRPLPPTPPVPPPPPQPRVIVEQPKPAPASTPIYKSGWFWGAVVVVVAGGVVGGLAAGGVFDSKTSTACPGGSTCR
jgi:hypothetical protein